MTDNKVMKSVLIPRQSRLYPTKASREAQMNRNLHYTPEKFKTYNDWFYFIHLDPYVRRIHALGMVCGVTLYSWSAISFFTTGLSFQAFIQLAGGAFFFYFLPVISHYIYDGGGARSTPDKFLPTLWPVIHINLMTLTGTYDRWLRKFIEKYPFTREAWELEEI